MKASLKKSLLLLHQISIIRPPHHLHKGIISRLEFPNPPIDQKTFPLSGISFWRLTITWNHPPIIFLWLTLFCWHNVWRTDTGVGWYWWPCCGSTESELASLQNFLDLPKTFLHRHIITLSTSQVIENRSSLVNFQAYEGGRYCSVYIWRSTTIFRSMAFNAHLIWMEEGIFWGCHPLWSRGKYMPPSPQVIHVQMTL